MILTPQLLLAMDMNEIVATFVQHVSLEQTCCLITWFSGCLALTLVWHVSLPFLTSTIAVLLIKKSCLYATPPPPKKNKQKKQ